MKGKRKWILSVLMLASMTMLVACGNTKEVTENPTTPQEPTEEPTPTEKPEEEPTMELTEETIEVVIAHPGEDASTQVNISWHSSGTNCKVEYTVASDTAFANATVKEVAGVLNATEEYYDVASGAFYNFKCTLENLTPGTEYIYRIIASASVSDAHSFTTAGNDGTFNFGWVADVHANPGEAYKMKNVNKLIANMENLTGDIDVFLFSGDLVEYGNTYEDWLQWDNCNLFRNYAVATVPGNKEYYKLTPAGRVKAYSGEWYLDNTNIPANGPEGAEACCWFIYDNVLFMSINSNQESGSNNKTPNNPSAILAAQQKWFRQVLTEQKDNYKYIVVQTHYAYFDTIDAAGNYNDGDPCSWGGYGNWRKLFDEFGVDLALSGDYHEYVRTNPIYKNETSTDSNQGTVYLTYTQIPTYAGTLTLRDSSNPLIAKCSTEGASTIASGVFTVTNESITFQLVGYDGKVVDSTTIPVKDRTMK